MTPEFKKVADHFEIYTKKPLFGQELTKALSNHYKNNADLYRKVGLIKWEKSRQFPEEVIFLRAEQNGVDKK